MYALKYFNSNVIRPVQSTAFKFCPVCFFFIFIYLFIFFISVLQQITVLAL